jgi:exodeoxyribonuclease VII large subunit
VAVYTVSQVTAHIRANLEADPFLTDPDLWIEGEVSNLSVSAAGHTYFSLKDQHSVLQAVMFRNRRGAHLLSNGALINAHGQISFYEPRGTLNITVDVVAPQGVGELALELERLKQKLAAEGLFDPSRKRPLPEFPKIVGVVTSPTGAAYQDIQNVLGRRYPLAKLVLSPTIVQGEQAAGSIAAALERLDQEGGCDVIIVARGGGSLEDLWAFNEEAVARAIYACHTPVVSGVGHETDETIADLVADLRAPTPSAAAEMIAPDTRELRGMLAHFAGELERGLLAPIMRDRANVDRARRQLESGLPDIGVLRRRVDDAARIAVASAGKLMMQSRLEIDGLSQRLRVLDPRATLERGFSIVNSAGTGKVITGAGQAKPGEALTITVADGSYPAIAAGGAGNNAAGRNRSRRAKPASGFMDQLL